MQFSKIAPVFTFIGLVTMVSSAAVATSETVNTAARDALALLKREAELPPLCIPVAGQPWNYAGENAIYDGIDYLRGIAECCVAAHDCVRVSCSYKSGIYLCNDNGQEFCTSCGNIADHVKNIIDACSHCIQPGNFCVTGGQVFDTDGFNVIVHDDSC